MALGKLPVQGRPTIWITVGPGPTALAVCAGGGCLDIFTLIGSFSPLSLFSLSQRAVKPETNNPKSIIRMVLSTTDIAFSVFTRNLG